MPGFHNDDERAAWTMAEILLDKARAMMRQAENALADNSFHVGLATMYYGAAAAHYSRAMYLRERGATPRLTR